MKFFSKITIFLAVLLSAFLGIRYFNSQNVILPKAEFEVAADVYEPDQPVELKLNLGAKISMKGIIPTVRAADADTNSDETDFGNFKISNSLVYSTGIKVDTAIETVQIDDQNLGIKISPPARDFRHGVYTLISKIYTDKGDRELRQDFNWGVLALNFDSSSYKPGQKMLIGMAALDREGATLCDAKIRLTITGPGDYKASYSSDDGTVRTSAKCKDKSVTNEPDYYALAGAGNTAGRYEVLFEAMTSDGQIRAMKRYFDVAENPDFLISRFDTSMRIYPPSKYTAKILIEANQNVYGKIVEKVPLSFDIENPILTIKRKNGKVENKISGKIISDSAGEINRLEWGEISLSAGDKAEIDYTYKAPDVSPQFYLLGPVEIWQEQLALKNIGAGGRPRVAGDPRLIFSEPRAWQIAADSLTDQPIYFWDTADGAIPANWTCMSCAGGTYDDVFPLASASAGVTGGNTAGHNHGGTGTVTVGGLSGEVLKANGASTNLSATAHTSTLNPADATISTNTTFRPKYATLKMIKAPAALTTIPQNVIAMFDNATPGGTWAAYTTYNDDIIMASASAGITGGSDTHTHTVTWPAISASTTTVKLSGTGASGTPGSAHTHTAPSSSTLTGTNVPTHTSVYLYKAGAAGESPIGSIAMFDINNPNTSQWSILSDSTGAFSNAFIEASSSYHTVQGSDTHSHAGITSGVTGVASGTAVTTGGGTGAAAHQHTHTMSIPDTSTVGHRPVYKTVVVAKNLKVASPRYYPNVIIKGGTKYGSSNLAANLSYIAQFLANLFNGTGQGFTGGSQANGGVDDYNNGSAAPTNRFSKSWTACTSGADNYCGTGDSGSDAKDNTTGLVWSLPCNGSGCATLSDSSPLTYSWDSSGANNNSNTAYQLCSGHAGWSLPHQKQLMQAYIDGSYGNLEAAGVDRLYWSATTYSPGTSLAWFVYLSYGNIYINTKTNTYYVRCVR